VSSCVSRDLHMLLYCSEAVTFVEFCMEIEKERERKICVIFINNQLDAQFFYMYVYFYSLHVLGSHVPIIRRINCINTSGICHSV